MKLLKTTLAVLLLAAALPVARADGWKLTSTTPYGTGGYWEGGQSTRIDCSYRAGVFKYERKVSQGTRMSVYSTEARFSVPKDAYAPGEDIGVSVEFKEQGDRQDYSPYARVTLLSSVPQWPKDKKPSAQIPATGTVSGEALDAAGRYVVLPAETVTLMTNAFGEAGAGKMCVVLSCNGMDVLYLYEWDGDFTPAAALVPTPMETPQTQEQMEIEMREEPEPDYPEPEEEEEELLVVPEEMDFLYDEPFPFVKLAAVFGVAFVLIALILFLFRKKKPAKVKEPEPEKNVCPQFTNPSELRD